MHKRLFQKKRECLFKALVNLSKLHFSSLFHANALFLHWSESALRVLGEDVAAKQSIHQAIVVVAQNYALNTHNAQILWNALIAAVAKKLHFLS